MSDLQSLRNRPNFFIIGAAKAGTTRLHYLLGQHPEVFTSIEEKEPQMFHYATPLPGAAERYLALFEDVGGAKAIGESSVVYSRCTGRPGTARRIREFKPDARIIYMLRHPLRRIESGWMQHRNGKTTMPRDFNRAVRDDVYGILDTTFYWRQLNEYRRYFPDEQILLLFFENFIQDEAATLRQCFDFLQVNAEVFIDCSTREKQNSFTSKREPLPLLDFLRGSRAFQRLCLLLPTQLKRPVSSRLMRPVRSRPVWDEATLRWVENSLREDTRQILSHAGKPDDFWD